MKIRYLPAITGLLLLTGCSDAQPPVTVAAVPHGLDARLVARGGELYRSHCAECHGANAEGAPNWQRKGPDGKLPPPPLDASGHAWHHPGTWLRDMIRQGSAARGGNMPAWAGKLGDDDIAAVMAWIQSRWPEEVYRSWLAMEEKSHGRHAH